MDLRPLIRSRGLKQSWLAAQIGVKTPRFSYMVRGWVPIPPDKAGALAKLLRVRVRDLTDGAAP